MRFVGSVKVPGRYHQYSPDFAAAMPLFSGGKEAEAFQIPVRPAMGDSRFGPRFHQEPNMEPTCAVRPLIVVADDPQRNVFLETHRAPIVFCPRLPWFFKIYIDAGPWFWYQNAANFGIRIRHIVLGRAGRATLLWRIQAMTWRSTMSISRLPILSLGLVLLLVGCGPDAKDRKIQDLTAENAELKNQLGDRERQMNDALAREGECRSTIDGLNQELARMRAGAGKHKETDGWITMPSFDMISIPGSVLFPSGKADLTKEGRSTLARLAQDINSRYSDRDIYVIGHTDNDPIRRSKWKDNWQLGSARSLEVVRTLQQQGVPAGNLVQANCGENRPRASNTGNAAKAQNRRVEFYAVKRNGGVVDREATASALSE